MAVHSRLTAQAKMVLLSDGIKKLVQWCKKCIEKEGDIFVSLISHISGPEVQCQSKVWTRLLIQGFWFLFYIVD